MWPNDTKGWSVTELRGDTRYQALRPKDSSEKEYKISRHNDRSQGPYWSHVKSITHKSTNMYLMLRKMTSVNWGARQIAATTIYKAVFLPRVTQSGTKAQVQPSNYKTWNHPKAAVTCSNRCVQNHLYIGTAGNLWPASTGLGNTEGTDSQFKNIEKQNHKKKTKAFKIKN